MGKTGIEAAAKQYGAEAKTYESTTAADRMDNVNAAINEGADIVVVLGFEFNDIIKQLAPTAPDTQFLIVDQCIDDRPDNVHCAVFKEYEASYLIGVEAGMLAKGKKVGVVGAVDIPFLHRYTDGYAQGVHSIDKDIQVDTRWVGGQNPFSDPVRAKEQAVAMHAAGDAPIFTATAGGDYGVFEAAKEKDFNIFSVDVNHCPEVPGHMIDVTLKHVDTALEKAIGDIVGGQKKVMMSLGLKEGGVSTVALEDKDQLAASKCLIADHPDVIEKVKNVAKDIEDGTLKLQDPMFAK
jgi:basic membrane protein A